MNMERVNKLFFLAILLLFATQFTALYLFGQPLMCKCGHIRLWEGLVLNSENSQQIFDWYSFSHIIHGFLFYALTRLFFPRVPTGWRLVMALGVEVTWEIIENTPMIIEHYRQQALSFGYDGDSIINSLSDSCCMIIGFCVAWRFPTWSVIAIALFLEVWLAYEIRDNFTLNIINLIHVFPAIKTWQAGAGAI